VVNWPTALPNKREKRRKAVTCDQSLDQLVAKKGTGTGKGGQDMVNWPIALPNKNGEERRGRLLLVIDCWIDQLQKRKRNRKKWPSMVNQLTAVLNKNGEERRGRLSLAIECWIDQSQKKNRKGGPRCG